MNDFELGIREGESRARAILESEIADIRAEIEFKDKKINNLMAYMRTLSAMHVPIGLCPSCKKYIVVDGFICFGCGYDESDQGGQ